MIQVSQCCFSAANAVALSWSAQNVYSSTMASLPVLSKRLGVIQGYQERAGHSSFNGSERDE